MTTRVGLAVAACLIAALPQSAAAGNAHCGDVTVRIRTLHMKEKWSAKSYPIGGLIKVNLTITRPSHEDPVTDDGQPLPVEPPIAEPAADVIVGVAVFAGDVYLDGGGLTNENGKATVKIPVESYTRPAVADTRIYIYKRYLDDLPNTARCVILEEWAIKEQSATFKITK